LLSYHIVVGGLRRMKPLFLFFTHYGNRVLFGSALLEQLGLPFPAMPVFLVAGILAGMGKIRFLLGLGLAVIGSLFGDGVWYLLGLWRGRQVLTFLCGIALEPDSCIRHTEERFLRFGVISLALSKFVPGVNIVIRPLAAISGISLPKFLVYDGLGTVAYVGTFMGIGYIFSDRSDQLERWIAPVGHSLGAILVVGLVGYVLYRYIRRRQFLETLDRSRISPDELKKKLDSGNPVVIVDLRSPLEMKTFPYSLPGARPMSYEEIQQDYPAFTPGTEIILYCNCPGEGGSAYAARLLQKHGYKARPLANGIDGWKKNGFPLQPLDIDLSGPPPAVTIVSPT